MEDLIYVVREFISHGLFNRACRVADGLGLPYGQIAQVGDTEVSYIRGVGTVATATYCISEEVEAEVRFTLSFNKEREILMNHGI